VSFLFPQSPSAPPTPPPSLASNAVAQQEAARTAAAAAGGKGLLGKTVKTGPQGAAAPTLASMNLQPMQSKTLFG
jgi:hypothetical protein